MSSSDTPIVVVGAGISGLCTALHLRRSMDRAVLVVDAGTVGTGTTPAGAGFVAPWATVLPHLGAAGLALVRYSIDFYREIAASGVDVRYRNNGNIVFFNETGSMATALEAISRSPQRSSENQVCDAREVADLTSGVVDADRIAGGIYMPRGIQIDTGLMLSHLADLAVDAGIEIRTRTAVEAVDREDGRVVGLRLRRVPNASGGDPADDAVGHDGDDVVDHIETDCAVLASGAWLNQILAPLGVVLPLLPFVATRFVTAPVGVPETMPTLQGKDFPLWIREDRGGFTWGTTPGCAPAHRLGAGWSSWHQPARWQEHLVRAMADDQERVARVIPLLSRSTVSETVQGMPVYTVDRRFFVGEVPGCSGLWAVGGDNESGVSHAPGLGRLMADLISGAPRPLCDVSEFRLDRFAPDAYPDAESVGQAFVDSGPSFIAEAMTTTALTT